MTNSEVFEEKREAFRKWIADNDFCRGESFKLVSDLLTHIDYKDGIESIYKSGYQPN